MKFLEQLEGTNYEDVVGKVSIDFHGAGQDLFQLCKDYGIDMKQYFPIGFKIYEEGILELIDDDTITLTILSLDRATYGDSFDGIADYLDQNRGSARVQTHHVNIHIHDLAKFIKRFSLIAITNMREHIKALEIEE